MPGTQTFLLFRPSLRCGTNLSAASGATKEKEEKRVEIEINSISLHAQLIDMKYHSITDGMIHLNMNPTELRDFFLNMQKELYHGKSVLNFKIENNIYGNIDINNYE